MATPTPWGGGTETKQSTPTAYEDPQKFKMRYSRHPQGGNIRNDLLEAKREEEKVKRIDQPERSKEAVSDQSVESYTPQVDADVARNLRDELGQSGDEILAAAKQFMTSGTATIEGMGAGGVGYNQQTGRYEATSDITGTPSFASMADQKFQELQRLRKEADKFFVKNEETGMWEARDFKDVVAANYNALSPDGRMSVDTETDSLMKIAEKLNRLEQIGAGEGAEAYSLRRQLQLEDKNGLVSGLYEAMKESERILSGEPIFLGDSGDEGYTLEQVLNLSEDEIRQELEKAVASASGLFGGDFEAAIEAAVDRESEEYRRYQTEEVQFRNTLADSGKSYFQNIQSQMLGAARDIKAAFDKVAPQIIEQMGDGADAELAREWFSSLMSATPQGFAMTISEAIYDPDSGIAVDQREMLASYIGDILKSQGINLGIDGGDAKLTNAIRELERTGQVTWTDSKGVQRIIKPSGIQKAQLLLALDEGPDKLKQKFEEIINGTGINLQETVNQITENGGYTSINRALGGFQGAIIDSLDTFTGSGTENALASQLMKLYPLDTTQWNRMSNDEKSNWLLAGLRQHPEITTDVLKQAADDRKRDFETQKTMLEKQFGELESIYANKGTELDRLATEYNAEYFKGFMNLTNQLDTLKESSLKWASQYGADLMTNSDVRSRIANGTLTQQSVTALAETLAMADYFLSVEQQSDTGDLYNVYMKMLDPTTRREISGLIEDPRMGAQPSGRAAFTQKLMNNPDLLRRVYTSMSSAVNRPTGELRHQLPSYQRFQASFEKLLGDVEAGKQTLAKGIENINNRRNTLTEIAGQFDKAIYDPSMVMEAAMKIAKDLEASGATGDTFFNLEGGERDRLAQRSDFDPEAQQQVDTLNRLDVMKNVYSPVPIDSNKFDVGKVGVGIETGEMGPVSEVVNEAMNSDKDAYTTTDNSQVLTDPSTGMADIYDARGNYVGSGFLDPMTGKVTDSNGNVIKDVKEVSFRSSWVNDLRSTIPQEINAGITNEEILKVLREEVDSTIPDQDQSFGQKVEQLLSGAVDFFTGGNQEQGPVQDPNQLDPGYSGLSPQDRTRLRVENIALGKQVFGTSVSSELGEVAIVASQALGVEPQKALEIISNANKVLDDKGQSAFAVGQSEALKAGASQAEAVRQGLTAASDQKMVNEYFEAENPEPVNDTWSNNIVSDFSNQQQPYTTSDWQQSSTTSDRSRDYSYTSDGRISEEDLRALQGGDDEFIYEKSI